MDNSALHQIMIFSNQDLKHSMIKIEPQAVVFDEIILNADKNTVIGRCGDEFKFKYISIDINSYKENLTFIFLISTGIIQEIPLSLCQKEYIDDKIVFKLEDYMFPPIIHLLLAFHETSVSLKSGDEYNEAIVGIEKLQFSNNTRKEIIDKENNFYDYQYMKTYYFNKCEIDIPQGSSFMKGFFIRNQNIKYLKILKIKLRIQGNEYTRFDFNKTQIQMLTTKINQDCIYFAFSGKDDHKNSSQTSFNSSVYGARVDKMTLFLEFEENIGCDIDTAITTLTYNVLQYLSGMAGNKYYVK